MDSTVQRPPKRSIFDQAGPEPKCISKFNQKLFSRSPPSSPKGPSGSSLPSVSNLSPGSLTHSSLSQKRTGNEPIETDIRDTADLATCGAGNRQKEVTGSVGVAMSAIGIPDAQEVVSLQTVLFLREFSKAVKIQDAVRDTLSEPAQDLFIVSEPSRRGETIS